LYLRKENGLRNLPGAVHLDGKRALLTFAGIGPP